MNLGICILCSKVVDIRFKHQCQKNFICHFCNEVRSFNSSGNLDELFYWTCSDCKGIHLPLFMTWERFFGFPSWINKKEWSKWKERLDNVVNSKFPQAQPHI